jgi:hypothetical protein
MMAVMAIALIALAGASMAQSENCVLGVYTDTVGSPEGSVHVPILFATFDVYVVIKVESTVGGVAHSMQWPSHIIPSHVSDGPGGNGIRIDDGTGGLSIGLGECAIGYQGLPIVVSHYSAFTVAQFGPSEVTVGPNPSEDPMHVIFADCAQHLIPCFGTLALELDAVIGTEDKSFGAVKSLYGN